MRFMKILSPVFTSPEPSEMAVVYVTTGSLKPYARNARTHNKQQIKMIADSIQAFGFTNPIVGLRRSERPCPKKILADISNGKIDTVVVYNETLSYGHSQGSRASLSPPRAKA